MTQNGSELREYRLKQLEEKMKALEVFKTDRSEAIIKLTAVQKNTLAIAVENKSEIKWLKRGLIGLLLAVSGTLATWGMSALITAVSK